MDYDVYYKTVAQTVRDGIATGFAPWLSDHKPGEREVPHNPLTGRIYNDLNGQYLDLVASKNHWQDPRWLSTQDITETNGAVTLRYGEKATIVARINKYVHPTLGEKESVEFVAMCNAEQVRGLPPYEKGRVTKYTENKRESYENNTDMAIQTAQEITHLYFKAQYEHGLKEAPEIEPIARYFLALSTNTAYSKPQDLQRQSTKLATEMNDHTTLRTMYNAQVYVNKITNPGFSFERREEARRTVSRDDERTQDLGRGRGLGR